MGSQLWDAAFTTQAIIASDLVEEFGNTLGKANNFIKETQIQDNPSGDFRSMYRYPCKGTWMLADRDHGWQVSDCTAEALKAILQLSQMSSDIVGEKIETERIHAAVDFMLSLQSENGGFIIWEPETLPQWLEFLNPAELFRNTLVEHEYVECTSSIVQALVQFNHLYPGYRDKEIKQSVERALQFIEQTQNPDGSWNGFWAICYTFTSWLALGALATCGKTYCNSEVVRNACDFLLSKQQETGGWGESYLSCVNMVKRDSAPLHKAAMLLINSQMDNGGFPQQEITGASMGSCMLHYAGYKNIFPLSALGEFHKHVLQHA